MKNFILNFMKSKPVAKKIVIKTSAKKELLNLAQAPAHQEFWVNRGPMLRNLRELANFLEVVDVERFNYHTKNGRNDFANWVRDILHDADTAEAIKKAKTISATHTAVTKALKRYKI